MNRLYRALAGALAALAAVPAVAAAQDLVASSNPCPATNLVWMTGMEHGRTATNAGYPFSTGSNAGGSVTAASSAARNGAYGLHVSALGSGQAYRGHVNDWKPVHVDRFALRLNALPTTNVAELYGVYATDSPRSAMQIGFNAATQSLTLRLRPNAAVVSSIPLVAGQWYVIETKYDVGMNPHRAELRVNGQVAATASLTAKATTLNENVYGTSQTADKFDADYDDIAVSQDANQWPLGDGRILKLSPNETVDGTHNGVTNFRDVDATLTASPIGPTTWQGVTDIPMDQPGRHIAQVANSSTSYVQVGFDDTAEPCVRAVEGWMSYDPQNTNQSNNGKTSVFDGTKESVVYSGQMSYPNTTALRTKGAIVPASGSSWTTSEVNSLVMRVGYSTDTSPRPWWDALLLEYDAGP